MGAVLGTKTNNEISLFAGGAMVLIPGESLRSPCRFALCCTHSEVDFLREAFSSVPLRIGSFELPTKRNNYIPNKMVMDFPLATYGNASFQYAL
jgi:hypothetical protein